MVEALSQRFRALHFLCALIALPSVVFGHRLDEYLQATIVAIEPGNIRLQINLTPGVAVAERVLSRIDRDHDGLISTKEAAAYAESIKRDLTVRLDGRKLKLKLAESDFPPPAELRSGSGIIQLEYTATPGSFGTGRHSLAIENRHFLALSVYLVNAGLPKSSNIRVTRQKRSETQDTVEIEFTYQPAEAPKP
ncbi:MAG TPA: hypothetical protein VMZ27_15725 [Candidatus Saccharimonadales bacterium]|nr:hypothetical protein [Candidatus Saccharimonadales bacterium]